MENKMFCHQCQETAANSGCKVSGVCGKTPEISALQDVLVYVTRGLCQVTSKLRDEGETIESSINQIVHLNLFITITNANFDGAAITDHIFKTVAEKNQLLAKLLKKDGLSDAALWEPKTVEEMMDKAPSIGVLATSDDDIRSLRWLIIFGLKGMAAYAKHASTLGYENEEISAFLQATLAKTLDDALTVKDLVDLTLETGKYGVDVMALLDTANTSTYGHPELSKVNLGVRNHPGILVSGHDFKDLEALLEQTKRTGIDVYTHGEMLPAHYYPFFKKFDNLVGNYGNAWWKQNEEFESFNGPILMTTNCLVPPKDSYKDKIYNTSAVGFPGCHYIPQPKNGDKDFSAIIAHAKKCKPPLEIENGTIVGGFAHAQLFDLAKEIVDAVKAGTIKKFVVMAGCDGRSNSRNYYTEFAQAMPKDTVILTAGCAKYRYNKMDLGAIGKIPRVLDAGQCNDSYSLAIIALKLKEIFQLADVNDLPIVYNIAWYEQKAIIVLLALLSLGVKDLHVGPTLPAFLSDNIVKVLVDTFGIAGIGTVEKDIALFFDETPNNTLHAEMTIAEIIAVHAGLSEVLMGCGMYCLGCPSSQVETLADACMIHDVQPEMVLSKIKDYLNNQ